MTRKSLAWRVTQAADAVFAEQQYVSATDVLVRLGWLTPSHIDRWRQGRIESLESVAPVDPSKVAAALTALQRWAQDRGLRASETEHLACTRDRGPLRFSVSGDAAIELAYRTHWSSPDVSDPIAPQSKPPELVVISPVKEWACTSCGGTGDLLFMEGPGPLCLDCADLGHLVFLPSGNAALTRRAKRASSLSAVAVRWSRSRKRYERQGILAESEAIERAEAECLSDAEARTRRRKRDAARRADEDVRFQVELTAAIREQFPGCPDERAQAISRHAATRGSGRIGRSAAGRALHPDAVRLAAAASVRHVDTNYNELLMSGVDRESARGHVHERVEEVLSEWRATTR
jgi:hypothetical protein